ncbi:efflux RND transporter periplasmic adaptor subunit [Paenirhodobacter populi]|uniref:Efflux RND transporter periplasmic adaptor subunit n=1 Tax=Paenirhodobacter populi TaxID=2306993 RepID=A0A443J906_9RHOB|nr:efflux RND transporter periplasmic adaptor subunit [Sinirhodobacter populi]RWR05690.1 efflux RND transporter periplasmic adaptor subunit [Sinirhodobacter populi]RWR06150.1 efflux RND transporter periplasmic adaptor subunit [Sinirhodobacter populi]RWR17012.1 efflux RND transporter periplasmic adaptor subunit [Sinirhodobacter populi]RWR30980.1 efflux RND transporter periplasmic adaptor subunit [Sinirhodobacter populi]
MSFLNATFRCLGTVSAVFVIGAPVWAQGAGQPAPVTVIEAKASDVVMTARLPGRIKASTVAEVRPQVSGILRERLFEEGSMVEAGAPLYKIEDDSYRAAVAAAKAAVAQAQANYDLAVTQEKRAVELFRQNASSAQARDTAVSSREAADAALQAAQAQLMSAEIDLDRTTVRAPISGAIGLSQTTTGALVAAQQATPLATIRTLDPVNVDVTQSATDILRLTSTPEGRQMRELGEAALILPDNSTYGAKGRLEAAEPQVEPTTGMVTLRMSYPNPDHILLPGMYVEVDLPQSVAHDAITLPQNTVMRDRSGAAFVWVVADGKVAQRPVHIAKASGNDWVLTDGVQPGDQVITSGFQKTAVGAPVQIVPDTPAPTAQAGSN